MSVPAVEATMPAHAAPDIDQVTARPATLRSPARPVCTAAVPVSPSVSAARPSSTGLSTTDLEKRLIAAHQRAADLEEQLAAVVAARDAAEHQAAQLEDRNRELASDLDNALDQLAGHALHVEQERLIHTPAWSPWAASSNREGYDR
ncbi:hypothetical protein AB0H00_17870 [Nocardia sp. NPDC023852]|uniref:hypothetical protein n=1 Tax=Nocardia sp. NPDC023852 TaxID=3154697 RepID=UPI0033E10D32